jgi:HEAT repeat protein
MQNPNRQILEEDDTAIDPLDEIQPIDQQEPSNIDVEEMLTLLSSAESGKRMIAARAFCEIEDSRSIPLLIDLLKDICPLVRVSVAYALGRNTNPGAVEPLIHLYNNDWNGYVRKGVVWALGNCCDSRCVKTLTHALKTDISAVRLWAASGLAQISKLAYEDMIKAIPPLIESLRRDKLAAVRSNCAWSIGQICRELPSNVVYATAVDALIESLVEDEDLGVKDDARGALLKIGDTRGIQMIEELELEGLI